MNNMKEKDGRLGRLPAFAPLAMSYVPMQEGVQPAYDSEEALERGTLFPGLDLPFMNRVNGELPDTPKNEMMALSFVALELALNLDTHEDDGEAFALYQTFLALCKEAHERYVLRCGPVLQKDQLGMKEYAWLKDPWPWDYVGKEG